MADTYGDVDKVREEPDVDARDDYATVEAEWRGPSKADHLRTALQPKAIDPFVEGDVIRWTSSDRYRYAVIKADGRYWFTGGGAWYGTRSVNYTGLINILNRAEVSDIAVAVAWVPVV